MHKLVATEKCNARLCEQALRRTHETSLAQEEQLAHKEDEIHSLNQKLHLLQKDSQFYKAKYTEVPPHQADLIIIIIVIIVVIIIIINSCR